MLWRKEAILALTRGGHDITICAREIGNILLEWFPIPEAHSYVLDTVKRSFYSLEVEAIVNLTYAICNVCIGAVDSGDVAQTKPVRSHVYASSRY